MQMVFLIAGESTTHVIIQGGNDIRNIPCNSLRPIDAYMHLKIMLTLVQIMACRVLDAKP